jgi:branched-subunit amino acid transport protein
MKTWLIMIALGAGTFLVRYSMIGLLGKFELPPALNRALRFIPASLLSALVVSQMLAYISPSMSLPRNPYLLAALFAGGIAWRTRNTFLVVLTGMVSLWVIRSILY